jgi:hypothetical protein
MAKWCDEFIKKFDESKYFFVKFYRKIGRFFSPFDDRSPTVFNEAFHTPQGIGRELSKYWFL